ncbi:hypothetical protein [Dolosigranulum pigrum]|uniref:hypothetical protein n=1 Tax=Dolosigranulum pigrum TaxID=29394 RepID=UPI0015EC9B8C|nr:hypothetical protein [Dolosigranulum pigrum]
MVKNNNINQTVYSFDLWGTLIKNKEHDFVEEKKRSYINFLGAQITISHLEKFHTPLT